MSKGLKVNDIARYNGPTVESMGLYTGFVYNITDLSEGLGVSINYSGLYFNQAQFEKVSTSNKTVVCDLETLTGSTQYDMKIMANLEGPRGPTKEEAENFFRRAANSRPSVTFAKGTSADEIRTTLHERQRQRKMKFSKKPGSAVVHYTAGQTFHISNLLALEVSHDYDDGDTVMVTRGYMKDGLTFVETVGIPVDMLSHIDWEPTKGSEHEGQTIKLTYSPEKRSIVYNVSFTANLLDFT